MTSIFDVFTLFGLIASISICRLIISYILGIMIDNGKGSEGYMAWFTDIFITSILVAGFLLYFYKMGVIAI